MFETADCKSIREIINTFADLVFESSFEEIRNHLLTVPSIASIQIRGDQLHPNSDGDAILILRLLHEAGFINPRLNDASKSRGFMHILFHDDPNFVKLENWNAMQAAKWEVHPAFRTYLMGIRDARLNRKKSSS